MGRKLTRRKMPNGSRSPGSEPGLTLVGGGSSTIWATPFRHGKRSAQKNPSNCTNVSESCSRRVAEMDGSVSHCKKCAVSECPGARIVSIACGNRNAGVVGRLVRTVKLSAIVPVDPTITCAALEHRRETSTVPASDDDREQDSEKSCPYPMRRLESDAHSSGRESVPCLQVPRRQSIA